MILKREQHMRVWVCVEIDGKFTSGNLICSCLRGEPVTHRSTLQLHEEQNHSQSEDEQGRGVGVGGQAALCPAALGGQNQDPEGRRISSSVGSICHNSNFLKF